MKESIYYLFQNKEDFISLPSFSFKNGDICGCGLVYPPPKMTEKLPYIFFTINGNQIGKAILVKENYEYLQPYIILTSCSIEANFGKDLKNKPFIYDITKHYVADEFEEINE
ncbi:hypothetical protein Mgra_00000555 [Meloidogyne graminicola]|uniref:Uncharacterized protein n=1 Tax=Meloidogyne graminicola TaxID=189291 RepID=A0A8T0A468_9BILA|nr:hypothetical protein Mgra_00000555 [Meloidogyne graminicola]